MKGCGNTLSLEIVFSHEEDLLEMAAAWKMGGKDLGIFSRQLTQNRRIKRHVFHAGTGVE